MSKLIEIAIRAAVGAKNVLFNIYIALNMLFCAVFFAPWAKPRETVSGFIGRKAMLGNQWFIYLAKSIDWVFREPGHCGEAAFAEAYAYDELYPEQMRAEMPANAPIQVETQEPESLQAAIDRGISESRLNGS